MNVTAQNVYGHMTSRTGSQKAKVTLHGVRAKTMNRMVARASSRC